MVHCTNCGAAAREGARFCTTCGTRLDLDTTATSAAASASPSDTATLDAVDTTPDATDEGEHASSTLSSTPEDAGATPDTASEEPETSSQAYVPTSEPDDTDASATWPDTDTPSETDETQSETISDETSTWPDADTSMMEEPQDPDRSVASTTSADDGPYAGGWPSPSTDNETEAEEAVTTIPDDSEADPWQASPTTSRYTDVEDDGPSAWEGWSPTPDPEPMIDVGSTVSSDDEDSSLDDIRALVSTLQQRLDRLVAPASVASRGVDADELADQLHGWAQEVRAPDDLLDVIRDARQNPRDIDAVTRLADRAGELERLVERYGTLCSDAERWVARLRNQPNDTDA